MNPSFYEKIARAHFRPKALPGEEEIDAFLVRIMQFLFPELNNVRFESKLEIETRYNLVKLQFEQLLSKTTACEKENIPQVCKEFFDRLEGVYDQCMEDAEAILTGDPAAYDQKEVIRTYPGFFAISVYRIAHLMLKLGIPYLPRIFTEYAHGRTGIDIHPAATIGHRFCIDHGSGVVIGETTVIGDDVKIYQGVTLGALSVTKEMAKTKRHPTIGDQVVIYAGATILGGKTTIGNNSIIGGNVWLTESVPANSRIHYDSKDSHVIRENC
ncbi:MAG: serine O-acetyltransferase [Cyclobacteriaceae bacterium]|nr:serine O-acetyltransferase [Cyclobacteriaceae bacterium]